MKVILHDMSWLEFDEVETLRNNVPDIELVSYKHHTYNVREQEHELEFNEIKNIAKDYYVTLGSDGTFHVYDSINSIVIQ